MIPNTLITSMIRKKDAAKYKAMDGNSVDNGSKSHKTKGKKRKKKKIHDAFKSSSSLSLSLKLPFKNMKPK